MPEKITGKSTQCNGIDREALESVIDSFRDSQPAEPSRPWRARVVWKGGFRATAHARAFGFDFDEPGLGSEDAAATPVEGLLAALGACLTGAFTLHATRQGVTIYNLEAVLEGRFGGMRTIVDLGEDATMRERGIGVKLYVRADADEATLREIWRKAKDASLVTLALSQGMPIDLDLDVV
ncbi:MAG: OsmC family protein [Acidimicrobiia bacterium]